ncbi:MAG: ABC transporter permease [Candidatus Woesearchaeota archaeon]
MILEYFKIAIGSIKKRQLRSWLTLIGIFIGIAAVVSLISIGQGLQAVIQEEFEALGANRIIVQPAGSSFGLVNAANPLTKDDVDAVTRVSGVDIAAYSSFQVARMEWADDTQIGFVVSIPPGEQGELIKAVMAVDGVELGSELRENERGVFLGYDYAFSKRYDTNLIPGRKITINGQEFQITGIRESMGNEQDNTQVVMNERDFNELFDAGDEISMMVIEVLPGRVPVEIVPEIEEALRRHRDLKEGQEDFEVETFENVLKSFLTLINVVQVIIIGIASISLFVGAVGITNTMYTAVIERTREIGIMKAIGARNSDIQNMFLIESGILGFIGGAIGVTVGISIGKIIEIIVANAIGADYLKPLFPAWLIIGALAFAFIIGSISGYLPAKQAAKMNPVDALATE